jgi:hypothetical protein
MSSPEITHGSGHSQTRALTRARLRPLGTQTIRRFSIAILITVPVPPKPRSASRAIKVASLLSAAASIALLSSCTIRQPLTQHAGRVALRSSEPAIEPSVMIRPPGALHAHFSRPSRVGPCWRIANNPSKPLANIPLQTHISCARTRTGYVLTTRDFANGSEAIVLSTHVSAISSGYQLITVHGSFCRGQTHTQAYIYRVLVNGKRIRRGDLLLTGALNGQQGGYLRRLTTPEIRQYDRCSWSDQSNITR